MKIDRWIKIVCITGISSCIIIGVFLSFKLYNIAEKEKININRSVDLAENNTNAKDTPVPTQKYLEDDIRINSKTRCTLQKFYVNTNSNNNLVEEEIPLPSDFIALDKRELEQYLEDYTKDMPLEEYLDGLISYEVVSFDDDRIIVRKTYGEDYRDNEFYVCAENGEVVVYYSDRKTVYEYTGINMDELRQEDWIKVTFGLDVSDEEELYALLESFSS